MPLLYQYKIPDRDAGIAGDKGDWIVQSLAARVTKASRRLKVADEGPIPPASIREWCKNILGSVHDPAYVHAAAMEPAGVFQRAVGDVFALRRASIQLATTRRDGSSSRIVGAIGGGMHHARRTSGRYGSTFNGLVVAADYLLGDCDVESEARAVLILDLDGSCGGGTAEMIAAMKRVRLVDIAVNERDAYASTHNSSLQIVHSAAGYLVAVRSALDSLNVAKERHAMCVYSAGVDGFEGMEGGLRGMTAEVLAERDRMVFAWCRSMGLRTVYTLGGGQECGGCSRETLVTLHRQTVEVAAMEASQK